MSSIEGHDFNSQAAARNCNVILLINGSDRAALVEGLQIANRDLDQSIIKGWSDYTQTPVTARNDFRTLALTMTKLQEKVDQRRKIDPSFGRWVDDLLNGRGLFDLTLRGGLSRPNVAIATRLLSEIIDTFYEELAEAIAPGGAFPTVGDARRLVRRLIRRPRRATSWIVLVLDSLPGQAGNTLTHQVARLQRVFDEHGVMNTTYIHVAIGPAAYKGIAEEGGFDNAAQVLDEYQAIENGVAEVEGVSGERLFDLDLVLDVPYRENADGRPTGIKDAERLSWLGHIGYQLAIFIRLLTDTEALDHFYQFREKHPDTPCFGTFSARALVFDKTELLDQALPYAVYAALKSLSNISEPDDPDAEATAADGRDWAWAALPVDTDALLAFFQEASSLDPVDFIGSLKKGQPRHIVKDGMLHKIRVLDPVLKAQVPTLETAVIRYTDELWERWSTELARRRSQGLPIQNWKAPFASQISELIDLVDEAYKANKATFEQRQHEVDQVKDTCASRFWPFGFADTARRATDAVNDYQDCFTRHRLLQQLSKRLRDLKLDLESFDHDRTVAATMAKLAVPVLKRDLLDRPAGLRGFDQDLLVAITTGVRFDPKSFRHLPMVELPGVNEDPDEDAAQRVIELASELAQPTVERLISRFENPLDLWEVQGRHLLNEEGCPEEEVDETLPAVVDTLFQEVLIDQADTAIDACNGEFTAASYSAAYILSTVPDIPKLEGDVMPMVLPPERTAKCLPFIAYVRLDVGISHFLWYPTAEQRIQSAPQRNAAIVVPQQHTDTDDETPTREAADDD